MSTRWDQLYARLVPLLGLRPWRQHSQVLAVGGAAYFVIGLAYCFTPLTPSRAAGLEFPLQVAPIETWGIVFIIVGVLAFASTRWPPASETWGYTAMSSLSAAWAMAYLLGILIFGTPTSTVSGVVVWGLFAFVWRAVSKLRNPEELLVNEATINEGE